MLPLNAILAHLDFVPVFFCGEFLLPDPDCAYGSPVTRAVF
ncbi:MAG: hypothetical protein ACP5OS_07470 [Leptospirillia bacterium]